MVVSNTFWVEPERGAIRVWYRPNYSSVIGSGSVATLLELSTTNGTANEVWWALVVSPNGNKVHLICQTESGPESCLQADVNWEAGSWHMLTLGFTPTNSALYIDDQLAAIGDGLVSIPKEAAPYTSLVVGSRISGLSPAQGQMEDLCVFTGRRKMQQIMGNAFGLSADWEIGLYYASLSKTAALGPISDEEIAARQAIAEQRRAEREALGIEDENSGGMQMLRLVGGTSECVTNSRLYITNTTAIFTTNTGWTVQFDIQGTNSPADIFMRTNLAGTNAWAWLERGPSCSTYQYTNQPPAECYYILGTMLDSDGDGITDAFEKLVSKTNPQSRDSDGDGIEDGDELSPNGIPWRLEIPRHSAVVVYATQPTTTEGGSCGEFRVLLPRPAPVGGVTVQYRLGGTAIYTNEFTVSPTVGSITIPTGNVSGNIAICAINNTAYEDLERYVEITLTNANNGFAIDANSARINLLDNDPPAIRVMALPAWVREPSATFGTNSAMFYFVRDGAATNALTVSYTIGGSATSGADYVALTNSVIFSAGVRTIELPVLLRADSLIEPDETIALTLNAVSGYQLDSSNNTATIVIAANGLTVPTVQVTATDDDAREAGLNPGQFTFTRTGSTALPLRVFYQTSGTASVGSTNSARDYVALPGYVDFAIGSSNAAVAVTPLDDAVSETMETIIVTIAAGDYQIGTNHVATVYLDDNEAARYEVETVRLYGIYGQSVNQGTEIKVTRYGTALSASSLSYTITAISPASMSYQSAGDANSTTVLWAARQSEATFRITIFPSTYSATANASCRISFPTLSSSYVLIYMPPRALLRILPITSTNQFNEGTTNVAMVRISRPYADNSSLNVVYSLRGSATNLIDYSIGGSGLILIPSGATSFDVPFTLFNDGLIEGMETVAFELQPNTGGQQLPGIGYERTFIRIKDAQAANPKTDTDMDGDEIPDGYELANLGTFDPLTPDDAIVDDDRDGVFLAQEFAYGMDTTVADTPPIFPSEDETDYVPLTLRLGAAGKLANPLGCAACHDTGINAGGFLRTTPRTSWEASNVTVDHLLRFLRGTNYPVSLLCDPTGKVLATSQTNAPPQDYTARYSAQFLSQTNTLYPFLTDTNSLLGTNRPMVLEALNRTATLFVPDLIIATDANGDGVVNFADRVDRTSTNAPFVFWVNDDNDVGNDDAAADEEVTSSALMDSTSTSIDSLRDLEDFARLQFRIDGMPGNFVTNVNLQTRIYITNLVGAPQLRIFRSVEANGGIGYLTNTTTGSTQVAKEPFGVLSSSSSLTLSYTNWQAQSTNRFFLPLIFEGISTGRCVVVFGLASNTGPLLVTSRPFYLDLQPVTSLYEHWTVGDSTTNTWDKISNRATRTADSAVFGIPTTAVERDYILFVHGWRMKPWERRSFASTGFKRLWQLGYRGRYGLFSWPTDWVDDPLWQMLLDQQNYDRSERRAWNSAIGLERLLVDLNRNYAGRVRMFAHSMGNVVASEALRLKGLNPNRPPVLHTYIASQAATVAHAYDAINPETTETSFTTDTPEVYAHYPLTGLPYFRGMTNAVIFNTDTQRRRIINFNNVQDYALNKWLINQDTKPDLGWEYFPATEEWRRTLDSGEPALTLQFPQNTYDIYAHMAEARSFALGAAEGNGHSVQGQIGSQVNLNGAPFLFKQNDYEHSAQFRSINMQRRTYWIQLLNSFSITP